MSKPVNDTVNKEWAAAAKVILTGNSPDITTLFTKLLKITQAEEEKLKSERSRDRFREAFQSLAAGLKYGWAHGISGGHAPFTRPAKQKTGRRVGALLPLAIAAGEAVGKAQAQRIGRAHGEPGTGSIKAHHAAATHAPAPQQ